MEEYTDMHVQICMSVMIINNIRSMETQKVLIAQHA